ncbi:hypothetical protein HY624_00895 [Candidatus Uhrbacteria bacterium]|nr:hypothetical protein [Candidatus Uhrbacteria bacterium]
MHAFEHPNEESIEARRERLMPILRESFEGNLPLRVTRKKGEGEETIDDLVVCGVNEDGPEFCILEADGLPGPSATMLWSEIIDVQ